MSAQGGTLMGVKVSAVQSLEAAGNVSGSGRGGRDLPGD